MIHEEILVEKSQVQRSTTTGALVITCPKANIEQLMERKQKFDKIREEQAKKKIAKELDKPIGKKEAPQLKVDQTLKQWEGPQLEDVPKKEPFVPDFDVDDVPPLE